MLELNFFITVSKEYLKPLVLEVGMNEINGQRYHVKQNPTNKYGMCYVLIPDQMWMKPYQDTFLITIFRNITLENMDMNRVFLQISSNETYNTINHKMTVLKNRLLEQEFVENGTILDIEYSEENIEFIKDCEEFGYFKCWAEKIAKTKDFNCTKRCVPIIFESLMDLIDEKIPKCTTPAEEYCLIGIESYKKYMLLKSTCLKVSRCFCTHLRPITSNYHSAICLFGKTF